MKDATLQHTDVLQIQQAKNWGKTMTTTEVAILGGGLAGLNAARLLHRAGIDFQLLEARDRLGGRILTVDETGGHGEDGFDLGPSWFWPRMQPELAALVADLQISAFSQHTAGDVLFERTAQERPYRTGGTGQQQASMRLVGGVGSLIRAIARDLPQGDIHMQAQVTELLLADGGVTVRIVRAGGVEDHLTAQYVISTLPPRLMAEAIRLVPHPAPAIIEGWRKTPTWMSPHAKFFAIYNRPFWREDGLSGTANSLVGPLAEIHDATTYSNKAALFGFVGIPAAQRAVLGPDVLQQAATEQLVRLFGPQAMTPRATLLKDWATARFTATAADAGDPSHPSAAGSPEFRGEWTGRLALSGSETSHTEPGCLAGAVEASRKTVEAWIEMRARYV